MGLKILKSRVVRPWGVWTLTLILLVAALVSFALHPSVSLKVGTMRGGIARSIVLEEGSLGYFRNRYSVIVCYSEPGPTVDELARLDQERWDLDWRSGWYEFKRYGIRPIRLPVWRWLLPSRPESSSFTVPLVLPLMLFGTLSFYSVLDERRRRRVLAGCCAKCGYSLAGLVSDVCPECGSETTSS